MEEEEYDFDVIVIGGGVAGAVAAYRLAEAGKEVALLERGESGGEKNLSGGVFYCRVMEQVFPDFHEEAPIERVITRNCITFLNKDSSVGIDYQDSRLAQPVNAVTVLRAKLDSWLLDKCEEAGVMVMPAVKVDRVLVEQQASGPQVVGVQAGDEELRARVVIAADGVNSFIAQEAGIREKQPAKHLGVGVKSVIRLDPDIIEQRFNVRGDEGCAYAIVGDATEGVSGGGFLYTNRDTISVGVVLVLDDLARSGKKSSDIHDHLLANRFIAPLLEGGELIEYGCHLVAEGGLDMMGQISTGGMLLTGDAIGLTLNTGFTVRGMDLAAASAIAASDAILEALAADDVTEAGLARYRELLFEGFAGKDMETYRKAPKFLESTRLYGDYGELAADILYNIYNHDLTPRRHLLKTVRDAVKSSKIKLLDLVKDGIAGVKAL